MSNIQINSSQDLRAWLENKPAVWAQAILLRAALRALPYIATPADAWLQKFALLPFGALLSSWIQLTDNSIFTRTDANRANARFGGHEFDFVAYRKEAIASAAADASYHSADAQSQSMHVFDDCIRGVERAAYALEFASDKQNQFALSVDRDGKAFWPNIDHDCQWLTDHGTAYAAKSLAGRPLWDKRYLELDMDAANLFWRLKPIDPNFQVWTDWYDRRVSGKRSSFDIPGDKGRKEDKAILRRLAEATDEDFWGKGHEYVNATLKGWLDEARARAALPSEPLGMINPDPQDTRSPQFGLDPTGHIAIKADAGTDQLRSDPQSLARHSRALLMAQKLGEALRNHNNAGYMTEMVDGYVAAMESDQERPDPSGLVFAGDQLRDAIAKHRSAGRDDDLQPLPPSADRAASAFLSAHNMYVGSDPFLDDLDRTTRGPDAPLPAAHPDEIRRVAIIARDDDILAEPTYDCMIAASEAAPATYDPADRHSRFAAGLAQNFARYGIELLWAYPNEAAWASLTAGAVVTAALGPLAAAGGAIGGIGIAYHMARNMIANEAIYEKLLATSPAGEDNFNRLMRFLKSLPIKSLKDN